MGHIVHRRDDKCMQSFSWENVTGRKYVLPTPGCDDNSNSNLR
jgi:hypothetical protein